MIKPPNTAKKYFLIFVDQGHLATVHNSATSKFLSHSLTGEAWLGGVVTTDTGELSWVDKSQVDYQMWALGHSDTNFTNPEVT